MDEDGDDMGDGDMDGGADIADMIQNGGNQSDDDIEDFADFGGADKGEINGAEANP